MLRAKTCGDGYETRTSVIVARAQAPLLHDELRPACGPPSCRLLPGTLLMRDKVLGISLGRVSHEGRWFRYGAYFHATRNPTVLTRSRRLRRAGLIAIQPLLQLR
jgi:hypothetical protein